METQPSSSNTSESIQSINNHDESIKNHKEKFLDFINKKYEKIKASNAVKTEFGEMVIKYLRFGGKIDAKLKFRIKGRKFCLLNEGDEMHKLGMLLKDGQKREVAFVENFYTILFAIHNQILAHSGENKTEYQIDLRYACFPESVVNHYIKTCPICSLKKGNTVQSTIIPIASYKTWERIQIDLIDMRYKKITIKDKEYNYICHVIDHFSSFNIMWALEHKNAEEVGHGLKHKVFAYFG
jgi:hypothetical protein